MREPLLATKESNMLACCCFFGRFLNTGKIKLRRKIRKIFFFYYCTQNKLKETELLLNK